MQTLYLLIDFINPGKTFGMTTDLEKIKFNVVQIPGVAESIENKMKSASEAISVITVCGRWIVVYQANVGSEEDTILYFVDFRIEVEPFEGQVFSQKAIAGIKQLQQRYDNAFKPAMDTVELSFAEVHENVIKPNLFACGVDEIVLKKAKELSVLPTIQPSVDDGRVRVTLSDDWEEKDGEMLLHIYALIRFSKTDEEESGYGYIRAYDVQNNRDLIDDFWEAVQKAGGDFERSYLIERFTNAKLN